MKAHFLRGLLSADVRTACTMSSGLATANPTSIKFNAMAAASAPLSPLKNQRHASEFCIAPIVTVATATMRR